MSILILIKKTYRITDFKISSTNVIVTLDIGFHFSNDFLVTLRSRMRSRATGIPDDFLDLDLPLVPSFENTQYRTA